MPNPAMGLRAIRFCLAEPQMFLTQLRAILRASHYGKVQDPAADARARARDRRRRSIAHRAGEGSSSTSGGMPYDREIEIGGMIEIPAAALALPIFMRRLDFLSIGTNDLIQYTLAIDRTDDAVAHLYDPLHPAVLTLVAGTIQTRDARRHAGRGVRRDGRRPAAHAPAARPRACATSRCILRSSWRSRSASCSTNLAEVQALAQRVLRASDPAKTRDLLAKLNS